MSVTNQQVIEAIRAIAAIVVETVNEAGPQGIPSGHMYAALATTGMNLDNYQALIHTLAHNGQIQVFGNVLKAPARA